MEREELLQRILDAPGDDRPRQVYADWLQERGDPRGAFIALQCEAARASDAGRRQDLARQADALLEAHRDAWAPSPGLARDAGEYSRGFLDDVFLDAEGFEAHWSALERAAPVRRLQLASLDHAQLARFLRGPGAARLTQLDLSRTAIGHEGAALLAEAPALRGLKALRLYACELGPVGVRTLIASPHFGALELLDLSGNPMGNEGVIAIATAAGLPSLREPRLFDVGARGEGLRALEARFGQGPHVGPALWCAELPPGRAASIERDGLWPLRRGERIVLGIAKGIELTIPSILGGRRNSAVVLSAEGECSIHHMGHSLPIFVNRRDLGRDQTLHHGDSVEMPYRGATARAGVRIGVRLVYLDGPRGW